MLGQALAERAAPRVLVGKSSNPPPPLGHLKIIIPPLGLLKTFQRFRNRTTSRSSFSSIARRTNSDRLPLAACPLP